MSRPSAAEDALADSAQYEPDPSNPIDFWRREGRWPNQLFTPGEEQSITLNQPLHHVSGRRQSTSLAKMSLDKRWRKEKNSPYRDPRYEFIMRGKGTYMHTSPLGVSDESLQTCRDLLSGAQPCPEGTIFDDAVFETACGNLQGRNELRVIQDLTRLIVPPAETLALYDQDHRYDILTETFNEGWHNSFPLLGTHPQPDYSVGFQRDAFTEEQLLKISPFIREFLGSDVSYFTATYDMYFPFLACEVYCGAEGLDVADRQNTHTTTIAARGVAELFQLLGREDEVHRKIVTFSVSHDHQAVRIYGCYPVFDDERKVIEFFRHPIHTFDLTEVDSQGRWAAYRFTKNLYELWMPEHFKWICSALDQLPPVDLDDVPALSASDSASSQGPEKPTMSDVDSASEPLEEASQAVKA